MLEASLQEIGEGKAVAVDMTDARQVKKYFGVYCTVWFLAIISKKFISVSAVGIGS